MNRVFTFRSLVVLNLFVLVAIVVSHFLPPATALAAPAAGSTLNDVVFSGGIGGFWVFDRKTGNIFAYELDHGQVKKISYVGTLVMAGPDCASGGAPCIQRRPNL